MIIEYKLIVKIVIGIDVKIMRGKEYKSKISEDEIRKVIYKFWVILYIIAYICIILGVLPKNFEEYKDVLMNIMAAYSLIILLFDKIKE